VTVLCRRRIPSHLGEIALPEAGAGKLEDPPGLMAAQELLHGARYGPGVGGLPAHLRDLLKELLVEHEVGPLHDGRIPRRPAGTWGRSLCVASATPNEKTRAREERCQAIRQAISFVTRSVSTASYEQ